MALPPPGMKRATTSAPVNGNCPACGTPVQEIPEMKDAQVSDDHVHAGWKCPTCGMQGVGPARQP